MRTESAGSESRVGSVMGTLAYMPPEQARGEIDRIDERADVFALGALLCEILTGQPPYVEGEESMWTQACQGVTELTRGRLAACGSDPELVDLALRCLSVEITDRPRHAGHVADAVSRHLSSLQERAHRAELAAAESATQATEERKRRRLVVALAGTIVTAGLLGGVGYVLWEGHRLDTLERRTAAARAVLYEVRALEGGARAAPASDVGSWDRAADAARQASLGSSEAEAGVRREIAATLARVEGGQRDALAAAARARRDREMTARLEELRLRRADVLEPLSLIVGYREAFEGYGILLYGGTEEEVAAGIRASAVADELCAALDAWALAAERFGAATPQETSRLLRISGLVDADPWRKGVRAAVERRDAEELQRILASAAPSGLSAASLAFAAEALAARTTPEAGIAFLERAHSAHAADFWVNFLLGAWHVGPVIQPARQAARAQDRATAEDHAAVEKGMGYLFAAQAVRPQHRAVRHEIGLALAAIGDWPGALRAHEAALAVSPDFHHAWSHVYEALSHTGGLEAAAAALRTTCEAADAPAVAWLRLGIAVRHLGRPEESLAALERAARMDPALGEARLLLSGQLAAMGRSHDAERVLSELVKADPANLAALQSLGSVRERIGDFGGAATAYEGALRRAPFTPRTHADVARALASAGRLDEAMRAHQELARRFPDDVQVADVERQLVGALQTRGRAEEAGAMAVRARAAYEHHLASRPQDASALYGLAVLLTDAFEEHDAAIEHLARVESHPIYGANALLYGGEARLRKGDLEGAADSYARFTERFPSRPGGILSLADLRSRQGHVAEATDMLVRAAQRFPRTVRVRHGAAAGLLLLGRAEEAHGHLRAVLDVAPDHPEATWLVGSLGVSGGREEEGLAALRRYREIAPWTTVVRPSRERWEETCLRLARIGRDIDAVRAGRLASNDPEDVLLAGTLCWDMGACLPAYRYFEQALREDRRPAPRLLRTHDALLVEEAAGLCAATLAAGAHRGPDAVTEEERPSWRRRSVRHLRDAIAVWETLSSAGEAAAVRGQAISTAARLRTWPFLAAVRDAAELHRLPEDERASWGALWDAVTALERRVKGN